MPLSHPAVEILSGIIVLIDLDVDEANPRKLFPDPVDDVDRWPAGAARTELRRCEDDDEGLVRCERTRN